ncbi:hypothetical protein [Solidesulfovibrio carbinoliphilus]|uniref:hypothetical protein n=1 Tax=Solidesulfovibrio carbinoliphilus TaxID=345370 RepID=UPI0012F4FC43|nr:hypothetical protein [Solidesulfovibrio carbinoliphilus]
MAKRVAAKTKQTTEAVVFRLDSSALLKIRGEIIPSPARPPQVPDGGNGETRDNLVCHRRGLSITLNIKEFFA